MRYAVQRVIKPEGHLGHKLELLEFLGLNFVRTWVILILKEVALLPLHSNVIFRFGMCRPGYFRFTARLIKAASLGK